MIVATRYRIKFCSGQRAAAAGLSLVELMISLLLGSVLSLTISKVYLASLRDYLAQEEMARIQDNGRFSIKLLNRELQLAGFYAGTPSGDAMPSTAVSSDCVGVGNWALDTRNPVDLVNNFSSPGAGSLRTVNGVDLSCLNDTEVVPGTDIVSIKRTAGNYTLKQGAYHGGAVAKTNRWYLRLEDYGLDRQWFYHRSRGFPSVDIGPNRKVDYWEYYARIFYIRTFSETATDGIPTLCVESLAGGSRLGRMATRCLVEGVEDMQIEFGVDSDFDGAANQFTAAPQRADIASVVVARIYLLLRSVRQVPGYKRARIYYLGSKRVEREDGYVRHVISATVHMPNLSPALG